MKIPHVGGLVIGGFVGTGDEGSADDPVSVPLEEVTKATAILGIRETGKSCLGTVFAEELCKARQPWIALDPVGNWWGLRAKPDGRPGGYPVVVFGGERGDLPIEKSDGKRIAEALISENVFAVIDLKGTSKTLWRTFVRDLVGELMLHAPEIPRKIFIEEAAEFIPQKTSYQLGRECSEIVERLVTLGGNYGYGATLLGQRSADIAKTALTQCETVFAFAAQSALDRKAYQDWMRSKDAKLDSDPLAELADLPTGTCWLWSPRFLKLFAQIQIRRRETFHPRDARKLKVAVRDVELAPVDEFVSKVRRQLTKTAAVVTCDLPKNQKTRRALVGAANQAIANQAGEEMRRALDTDAELVDLSKRLGEALFERDRLRQELAAERARAEGMANQVATVRKMLRPYFETFRQLFDEIGTEAPDTAIAGAGGSDHFDPWREKAGNGVNRRLLEIVINNREISRAKLAALAVIAPRKTAFRNGLSWLRRNGLIETVGDVVRLRPEIA